MTLDEIGTELESINAGIERIEKAMATNQAGIVKVLQQILRELENKSDRD